MSDWGKGAKNNTIGWGQGACDNTIGWGTMQKDNNSWSGDTDISGCSGAAGLAQIDNLNSMSFDGASDFINNGTGVGDALGSLATNFSVSGWFKTLVNPLPSNEGMFGFGDYTDIIHNSPFRFYQASYNNFLVFFGHTIYHTYIVDVYFPASNRNAWRNYIIIYDGSKAASVDRIKLYVDGNFVSPFNEGSTIPSSVNLNGKTNTIGVVAQNRFYNGSVDELAVFNYSLTEAEALSIYNATAVVDGVNKTADLSQLTTPPIAWYRM
jgi:hypothetical protein